MYIPCVYFAQMCVLDLLDDQANPRLEGNETFVVFLSSSVGSLLAEPQSALIIINDTKLDSEFHHLHVIPVDKTEIVGVFQYLTFLHICGSR